LASHQHEGSEPSEPLAPLTERRQSAGDEGAHRRGGLVLVPDAEPAPDIDVLQADAGAFQPRDQLDQASLDRLDRFGLLSRERERRLVGDLIAKLQIRLRSPRQALLRLSGGNQQKVAIAPLKGAWRGPTWSSD